MKTTLKAAVLVGTLAIGAFGGSTPAARAQWGYNPQTGGNVWVQQRPVYRPIRPGYYQPGYNQPGYYQPGYNQYIQNELLERQLTGGRDIPDPGDAIYRPSYPVYNPGAYNQYLRNELLERQVTGGHDIPDAGDVIFRP